MAKAHVTLPNGTRIEIEGTPDEVRQLLEFYSGAAGPPVSTLARKRGASKKKGKRSGADSTTNQIELSQIISHIKSCDEAEAIETQILDRTSQVDRTLLPLFIIHEYFDNDLGLTSGDISKITTDLGIPLGTPNVSRTLANTASKYVIGDSVRKRGRPVRYKLARRGLQYMKKVLEGS